MKSGLCNIQGSQQLLSATTGPAWAHWTGCWMVVGTPSAPRWTQRNCSVSPAIGPSLGEDQVRSRETGVPILTCMAQSQGPLTQFPWAEFTTHHSGELVVASGLWLWPPWPSTLGTHCSKRANTLPAWGGPALRHLYSPNFSSHCVAQMPAVGTWISQEVYGWPG